MNLIDKHFLSLFVPNFQVSERLHLHQAILANITHEFCNDLNNLLLYFIINSIYKYIFTPFLSPLSPLSLTDQAIFWRREVTS